MGNKRNSLGLGETYFRNFLITADFLLFLFNLKFQILRSITFFFFFLTYTLLHVNKNGDFCLKNVFSLSLS